MAGWGTKKNQHVPNLRGFDEGEMMMGVMVSQKPGNYATDLIQNCDLPPPTKLFSGSYDDKTVINYFNNREKLGTLITDNHGDYTDDKDGKTGLLRALRLSQTRAREAQARCEAISKERDSLALALVEDSMQLFGYRQLVKLLEFQVSSLQLQRKMVAAERAQEEDGSGSGGLTWIMAVTFCLGIAGFGFAFAWNYY